jgi:hypothetical protein
MTAEYLHARDSRVERIVTAAQQHGANSQPDHEVGDLQEVLRAAWSLMLPEQRDQLMAAAATRSVLDGGDEYFEVAQLRGYLLRDGGVHRVLIEMTRGSDGASPRMTSLKVFDSRRAEVDWQSLGLDIAGLVHLAQRLEDETVEVMPPNDVVPAWVSTLDWDLSRDILTHSIVLSDYELGVKPQRWLNASTALDAHRLGVPIENPEPARALVMEVTPAANGEAQWVEMILNQHALDGIAAGVVIGLDSPATPVALGTRSGNSQPDVALLLPGESDGQPNVRLRAVDSGTTVESGLVPLRLFLEWHAQRPIEETLFVSAEGALLNEEEGFARHVAWIDEYHRSHAPDFEEVQTEFETERPNA